eukprot:scaffold131931_cov31-Tisochrysis_lutea.AAC.1
MWQQPLLKQRLRKPLGVDGGDAHRLAHGGEVLPKRYLAFVRGKTHVEVDEKSRHAQLRRGANAEGTAEVAGGMAATHQSFF